MLDPDTHPVRFRYREPYKTGLSGFEREVGVKTLQPGHVIAFSGKPGGGKTALATNLAYALQALNEGLSVVFISLEMSREDLYCRIVSEQSGFPAPHVEAIVSEEPDIELITRLVAHYGDAPVRRHVEKMRAFMDELVNSDKLRVYDDTHEQIRDLSKLEFHKGETLANQSAEALASLFDKDDPAKVFILDYAQMMANYSSNHHENLEVIADLLRRFARDADKLILALSQNSGDTDRPNRDDQQRSAVKLRSMPKLEQGSITILHLDQKKALNKYEAVIPIYKSKSRYSAQGETFEMRFLQNSTRFVNWDKEEGHARDLAQSQDWMIQ